MKTAANYLIAKYIPDLRRMEPRNIGIILWVARKSYCRFLPLRDALDIVRDPNVYARWISFWGRLVREGVVRLPGHEPETADSEEYLAALKKTQKENYVLDDGGEVVSKISSGKGGEVVDFLFEQLVATRSAGGGDQEETFAANATRVLAEAGIAQRDDFQGPHEVECDYKGIPEPLRFHYYIGDNGTPKGVAHRVKVANHQSVNSAAWMFERLASTYPLAKRSSIINTADIEPKERKTKAFLSILENLSTTIDIADESVAVARLRRWL